MQSLPRFFRTPTKLWLSLLGFLWGIAALAIPAWLWWICESSGMRSDQLVYSVYDEILLHVIRKDPLQPSKGVGVSIPDLWQGAKMACSFSRFFIFIFFYLARFFIGPRRSRHTVAMRQMTIFSLLAKWRFIA